MFLTDDFDQELEKVPEATACGDDFEVTHRLGELHDLSYFGDGDVVGVRHKPSGKCFAMKRLEVKLDFVDDAARLRWDLLRSTALPRQHGAWRRIEAELSYVQTTGGAPRGGRARIHIVEELEDRSLRQDLVEQRQAFGPILPRLYAVLLHALEAFHTQGCLHRSISANQIVFVGDEVKLGCPGPSRSTPPRGYYPGKVCEAYSADIFALGVVFLEMATLRPLEELLSGSVDPLGDLVAANSSADCFCTWLDEQTSRLDLEHVPEPVKALLAAMFASPAQARPTADDLLDFPVIAAYVDPLQVASPSQRPCVVHVHDGRDGELAYQNVNRRDCTAMPWMHQIFCTQGGSKALKQGWYRWCGYTYELWWLQEETLDQTTSSVGDSSVNESDLEQETKRGAARLAAIALEYRRAGRLVGAEQCYRAALRVGHCEGLNLSDIWLGLSSTLLERGRLGSARLAFEQAQKSWRELAPSESQPACIVSPTATPQAFGDDPKLWGLGEFFLAVNALRRRHHISMSAEASSPDELSGRFSEGDVQLYYRSALAVDECKAEVLAGIGEFYRLVGCPRRVPFRASAPDIATAISYFEQARNIDPDGRFVGNRLQLLRYLQAALRRPTLDEKAYHAKAEEALRSTVVDNEAEVAEAVDAPELTEASKAGVSNDEEDARGMPKSRPVRFRV